jgi:hypothetical protein
MAKSILIIGGTGTQGSAAVRFLSSTGQYDLNRLRRDPTSSQAQELAQVPHVALTARGYEDGVSRSLEGRRPCLGEHERLRNGRAGRNVLGHPHFRVVGSGRCPASSVQWVGLGVQAGWV